MPSKQRRVPGEKPLFRQRLRITLRRVERYLDDSFDGRSAGVRPPISIPRRRASEAAEGKINLRMICGE